MLNNPGIANELKISINLTTLSQGIYIIEIENKNHTVAMQKIIKN